MLPPERGQAARDFEISNLKFQILRQVSGMQATWKFRATRASWYHSWIKRTCGQHTITGSEHDALDFARRITEHFRGSGVTVEAWSVGEIDGAPDIPDSLTFRIVPHENGKDWRVVECQLRHPLWIKKWEKAIGYMLFRAPGRLCVIHVIGKNRPHRTRGAI